MIIKPEKIAVSILCMFLSLSVVWDVYGAEPPEINSHSAILIEQETGKILYEKNADETVYPASMTKILVALEMLDYIELDEIIVTGSEVHNVPLDSSKAGHLQGESISGINLVRALMLPSGNETGCVAAAVVAKRATGNYEMPYSEAEEYFCNLLNERAKEMGATNTNFANPHGYHDDNHYTTAKDLSIMCREAINNETINEIMREKYYEGNGAGDIDTEGLKTQEYTWNTTNKLLVEGDYYYPYATGIKTGFTNEAGRCLASSAEKDGKKLIAVVFNAEDPGRWEDSIALLDYGFDNYEYVSLQEDGEVAGSISLSNPRLGENDGMEVLTKGEYKDFLSQEEIENIKTDIVFDDEKYFVSDEEDTKGEMLFDLPIYKGDALGKIVYTLNNKVLYEGKIIASETFEERTRASDMEYYKNLVKENAFTVYAIPFWLGLLFVILIIIYVIVKIRNRKKRDDLYIFDNKRW